MILWTIICVSAGFVAGAYWKTEVFSFFGNLIRKITNK